MGDLIAIIFIGLVVFLVYRWLQPRSKYGKFYVKDKVYQYEIGDDVIDDTPLPGGKFNNYIGISIPVDQLLPHIYLDSHHDSKISGPRYYMPKKNRVSLEGDFDKYFQLYAADGYKQLALTIITPDVMATMIKSAQFYDIEVHGKRVRLISQTKIYNKPVKETAIIEAAKTVIAEIQHKMKSWTPDSSLAAGKSDMEVIYEHTAKVGRYQIRLAWVMCLFVGVIFGGSWMIGSSASGRANHVAANDLIRVLGLLICLAIPFAILYILEYLKKYHPKIYDFIITWFAP